jgi:hypothetical protein
MLPWRLLSNVGCCASILRIKQAAVTRPVIHGFKTSNSKTSSSCHSVSRRTLWPSTESRPLRGERECERSTERRRGPESPLYDLGATVESESAAVPQL